MSLEWSIIGPKDVVDGFYDRLLLAHEHLCDADYCHRQRQNQDRARVFTIATSASSYIAKAAVWPRVLFVTM